MVLEAKKAKLYGGEILLLKITHCGTVFKLKEIEK
jgi:hypothetical protein